MPQPPQLASSLRVSTHTPPHEVSGAMQRVSMQRALEQVSPALQALPQAPQLLVSLVRSRQPIPQSVVGGVHGEKHVPKPHSSPEPQRRPHAPQLFGSTRKSVHPPSQATSGAEQRSTHERN